MKNMRPLTVALASLLIAGTAFASEVRPDRLVVPNCREQAFRLTGGSDVLSEPTGQHSLGLRLRNRGRSACLLYGYPRIELRDRRGTLPFRISHTTDQVIRARPPIRVVVRPGRVAWVVVNKYRCDRGDLRPARRLRLAFSGGGSAIEIAILRGWIGWCGRGDPGSSLNRLTVRAVVPCSTGSLSAGLGSSDIPALWPRPSSSVRRTGASRRGSGSRSG